MPNYGANDSALVMHFNGLSSLDFSGQIGAFGAALRLKVPKSQIQEDCNWLEIDPVTVETESNQIFWRFDTSGYYILNKGKVRLYLRSGNNIDRPHQADNHHIDVWYDGVNVLWDSGSYHYNTTEAVKSAFWGTAGHNTVQLGTEDQMLKGPRFMWLKWSQQIMSPVIHEHSDHIVLESEIAVFQHINKNISHTRKIKLFENKIEIADTVNHCPPDISVKQLWHLNPKTSSKLDIKSSSHIEKTEGLVSLYYGSKETSELVTISSDKHSITTTILLR